MKKLFLSCFFLQIIMCLCNLTPGLALYYNKLYSVGRNGNLYALSHNTGDATLIGYTGYQLTDIAFKGANLYGISFSNFYKIDPNTGRGTHIGATGFGALNSMAVDPKDGTIYAAETGSGKFIKIDPNTGKGALVGNYNNGYGSSGDMAFAADGTLYAVANKSYYDYLVKVDKKTGYVTSIGKLNYNSVYGLSFLNSTLYGVTDNGLLLSIDKINGQAKVIKNTGISQWGMTTSPVQNSPYYLYNFQYKYKNGDYYLGQVYARANKGYGSPTFKFSQLDENGQIGGYTILSNPKYIGLTCSQAGKVIISKYYDYERQKFYTPVANGQGLSGYLGNEYGYIVDKSKVQYRFGKFDKFYEADAGDFGRYYFTYNYADGSGDSYKGVLIDKEDFLFVGQKLQNTAKPLANDLIKGYYQITNYLGYEGFNSKSLGQLWVTSYYDGDTKKTSKTFNTTRSTVGKPSLVVANRHLGAEKGYVYDPSVPANDPYFGNADVTYAFNPNSNGKSLNFLAVYLKDLPYWDQPTQYPGSCDEVAGAVILSYWDRKGFPNLISSNWQTEWPHNTKNINTYVNFVGTLADANHMKWTKADGTDPSKFGPGLQKYAQEHGGYSLLYKNYTDFTKQRLSYWSMLKQNLNAAKPVCLQIYWEDKSLAIWSNLKKFKLPWITKKVAGHAVVARGYWNSGQVVALNGHGTTSSLTDDSNIKLDWWRTEFSTFWINPNYDKGVITYMTTVSMN